MVTCRGAPVSRLAAAVLLLLLAPPAEASGPDGSEQAYQQARRAYYQLKEYQKAWADIQTCRKNGGTPQAKLVQAIAKAAGQVENP